MINTIIFDFGGVLLNLDYSKTDAALKQIFQSQLIEDDQFPPALTDLFLQVEKGRIDPTQFIRGLRSFLPDDITDQRLIDAWNAMLGNFPKSRLKMLQRLSKSFQLFLLSNTNAIHIQHVHTHLKEDHGIIDFEEKFFDDTFYSHLIGMRKPDTDIYKYVLDRVKRKPEEIIFIDDTKVNLNVPKSLGVHCIHHNPTNDIAVVIDHYIDKCSQ